MILKKLTSRQFVWLCLMPMLILLIVVTIAPFMYLIYTSFNEWQITGFKPRWVGLTNFINIFVADSFFRHSSKITFIFWGVTLPLEFFLGLSLALLVENPCLRFKGLIRTFLLIPMVITPVVVGLTWRTLYNPTYGLINYFLSLLGIKGLQWVARASTALPALILVDVWQWTPFIFLMIFSGLQTLPQEPIEAAMIDGASTFDILRFVKIPMLRQVIIVSLLLRTVDILRMFDIIYMITKGGPGSATETLQFYTFEKMFSWMRFGYGAALAVIMLIMALIIAQFFVKLISSNLIEV